MSEHKKKTRSGGSASGATSAPRAATAGTGPMDVNLLEQLVKLMAENGLSTVELTDGDQRVLLKRGPEQVAMAQGPMMSYAPPQTPAGAPASAGGSSAQAAVPVEDDSKLVPIKSPMPGTFYAAPSKGAKPFVAVGGKVDEETDVCIVEAMKVFNTLKAETRGTIAKILVVDGQTVEYGTVLFLVKP